MDITQIISLHADQLLPHHLLLSWLKEYKGPNDKILGLKAQGFLEPLKKDLYITGPSVTDKKPDALPYYGLIPERVYEISSMTTKASRSFNTVLGMFTYTRLSFPYYSFGLKMLRLPSNQYAIVASPEKVLCNKIVTTSGLTLRSIRSAYDLNTDTC